MFSISFNHTQNSNKFRRINKIIQGFSGPLWVGPGLNLQELGFCARPAERGVTRPLHGC